MENIVYGQSPKEMQLCPRWSLLPASSFAWLGGKMEPLEMRILENNLREVKL